MKYLLSWVCKHLKINSWQELGAIEEIVKKITMHVTEVASWRQINYTQNKIAFATIIDSNSDICLAQYNDEKKVINLPPRKDAEKGLVYIIVQQDDNKYRFATMKDLYAESKNNLMSALYGNASDNLSYFKKIKKQDDYIIKIDNTSINNRPDLLSHRGLARELGLIFNKKMLLESEVLFNKKNIKKQNIKEDSIFTVHSDLLVGAAALTGGFHERQSFLSYILDMTPLDITSHSYLIDLSNYIMLDVGQPIHIFDKQKIQGVFNFVDNIKGSLEGLDNITIDIDKNHLVIAENNEIHSLVGIIGGKNTAVSMKTKEIIIESAAVKKEAVIHSAKWFKKKTESVIRNEKGSSVEAVEFAILRFLKLINTDFFFDVLQYQFFNDAKKECILIKIFLSLPYLEKVIGIRVDCAIIEKIFIFLGFLLIRNEYDLQILEVGVPWWRKDINNEDDLIEEVVRHIGYDALPVVSPKLEFKGIIKDNFIEKLKNNTIILTLAQEIVSYGISDEEKKNKWSFIANNQEVSLKNPYSDRQKYMVSSVLPNFLDTIHKEVQKGITSVVLFEINPLWHIKNNDIKEELYYTLCFYEENDEYDFYFIPINESMLKHNLFSDIAGNIYYENTIVGICGFIDPLKIYKENKKAGILFAVEINLALLKSLKKVLLLNHKYPSFDISILVKKTIKIASILIQLQIAFGGIMHIKIIDWFESKEWFEERSITIRIFLMNNNINELYTEIKEYLIERDCVIR